MAGVQHVVAVVTVVVAAALLHLVAVVAAAVKGRLTSHLVLVVPVGVLVVVKIIVFSDGLNFGLGLAGEIVQDGSDLTSLWEVQLDAVVAEPSKGCLQLLQSLHLA